MREIKFRAWDSLNNQMWQAGEDGESIEEWTFQTYFNPSDHCFKAVIYGERFLVIDDPYPMYDNEERQLPIMQYTGLKDKNGVEIYEGDIVKFPSHGDSIAISDVAWEEGAFVVKDNVDYYDTVLESSRSAECIVIGNIHQNPELMAEGCE